MSNAYAGGLKPYVSGDIHWIYPQDEAPPRGRKLHILQEGCISIQGVWMEGQGYMAWQRMFKRNHEKEREYAEFLLMRKKQA
jgi:hypothetical protein